MTTDECIYVVDVQTPDGEKHYVTLLPPDTSFSQGLMREVIAGELLAPWESGKPFIPEFFVPNPAFVEVMHEVIGRVGPELPNCRAEAHRIGDGFLYLIDQRTPTPGGAVPPEDIIGAFEVRSGAVVEESYRSNSNHKILSTHGFFRLDAQLRERLVREFESRNRKTS
jgi:hypothetical protein